MIKRGGGAGYAGIENMLFYKPNTKMFYGSAINKVNEVLVEITEKSGDKGGEKKKEIELEKT